MLTRAVAALCAPALVAAATASIPVGNNAKNYFANVTVGTQTFNLLVDTGSSNTWIGANQTYVPGADAVNTEKLVEITYGSGYMNGTEWYDTVTIGDLTVHNQSIGVAAYEEGYGYQGIDGILGLGGVLQTNNTVDGVELVPTLINNLLAQGLIDEEVLGVYFEPLPRATAYAVNGELTIGGVDPSHYTGDITWTPALTRAGQVRSWMTPIDAVSYNAQPLGTPPYTALFDTGTTNIYIPPDAYFAFLALANGTWDQEVYLSRFDERPTGVLAFSIGGRAFELTPEMYMVPEDEYGVWGLPEGTHWSFVSTAGEGNFFVGQKFFECYYSVYDTTNARIGFAAAKRA
ncbi:acid protease [Schizophyllum commune Tattone D]|nr:acid protease [Schizophyllum commune Tattone D]